MWGAFLFISGLAIGGIVGIIAAATYGMKLAVEARSAALEGAKQGQADKERIEKARAEVVKLTHDSQKKLNEQVDRIKSRICAYMCDSCLKTFTLVGPELESCKCPICGGASIPVRKAKTRDLQRVRDAEAMEA